MKYKKKKVKKYRGSKTHGSGAMKKRRGAGNRGGRGRAGSGKRADTKKPSYWKQKIDKKGFVFKRSRRIKAINLEFINKNLNTWLKKGLIVKKPAGYEVELIKMGYNKLLGTGKIKEKFIIITSFASKKAVEKVKKAGGEVRVLQVKKEKPQKTHIKKRVPEPEEPETPSEPEPKSKTEQKSEK